MKPKRTAAFLSRLGQDTSGNVLAIFAAAFFPMTALIGGGVDISRIYITQTRMQQACDAGALAGRKAMGAGSWTTTGTNNTRDQAYLLFQANFASGAFGTGTLAKDFTESDGTVTGTASTTVPMTLMQIFGYTEHPVAVTCTSKMEIPNTDVMFVLDLTASMNCAPGSSATCFAGTPQANAKILGLRSAVKCFYEALLKVNTAEVCGDDPTGSAYSGTAQIRLGFVPYGVNVNVGRLLPNEYMIDTGRYQTREANTDTVWGYTLGTESSTSWGGWSAAPTTATLQNQSGYSGWTTITGSGSVNVNGTNRPKTVSLSAGVTNCNTQNLVGTAPNKMLAYTDPAVTSSPNLTGTTNNPPNHSNTPVPTQQTLSYSESQTHTVTGYKYLFDSSTNPDRCRLQSGTRNYTISRAGTSSKSITWTQYEDRFLSWTYKQKDDLDVSGLKAGGESWNASVSLPLALSSRSVTLSGQNSPTTMYQVANTDVAWDGCIEERPTFQNTDGNLSDDWNPVPSAAVDMDINLVPTGPANQWKPLLRDVFWGRYTGTASQRSSTKTLNSVTTPTGSTTDLDRNISESIIAGYYCPETSRKLTAYNTVGDLESYIGSLNATSMGTYHDIGLLWGARLLSPVGIFADENELSANGGAIERHLIFMTDGDASTFTNNLYAYGSAFWDRRQTSYNPSSGQLDGGVEGRLTALCTSIRNMNIELWVISYGGAVDAANEARLQACASPGRYFSAANTPALIANFKQIASEIADLRLTD